MSTLRSIQQLNQKAFQVFHSDGILDILIGASLIGFGTWQIYDIPLLSFIAVFAFSNYLSLKKAITFPRLGFVSFEEDKKQRVYLVLFNLILLAALIAARFFLFNTGGSRIVLSSFLRKYHPTIMGTIGALLLIALGIWRRFSRFIIHGTGLAIILWIFYLIDIPGKFGLLIAGILIFLTGLIFMGIFIKNNPILPKEVQNAV